MPTREECIAAAADILREEAECILREGAIELVGRYLMTRAGHRYLTPVEVAELAGFAVQTLANWRSLGSGPPYLKVGRLVRYDETELEAWMRSQPRT